jgi:hypothetical protein
MSKLRNIDISKLPELNPLFSKQYFNKLQSAFEKNKLDEELERGKAI